MPTATSSESHTIERVTEDLLGRATRTVADLAPGRLAACAEEALRRAAAQLGLTLAADAPKALLVAEVSRALARLAAPGGGAPSVVPAITEADAETQVREAEGVVLRSKFNLGEERQPEAPRHVPWGYGYDRITAMVVNPHTLFIYWELTDQAIEAARREVGPAGVESWINLRVYDVSGRIFDGTNAHSYADYKVDRNDRQWFVEVNKPGSTAIVDVGVKSIEGYFVKITRSGRADFPRHGRAPEAPVEWLTVRTAAGEVEPPIVGGAPIPRASDGHGGAHGGGGDGHAAAGEVIPVRSLTTGPFEQLLWHTLTERWWSEGHEVIRREWIEAGRTFDWVGPLIRTTWEAGPFPVPVEAPVAFSERYEGPIAVYSVGGQTRVVFGPWQVVIRGLAGWAEKRVLARWEVFTSWVAGEGVIRELQARQIAPVTLGAGGASEALLGGASELRWLFGSELRLAGASEVYLLGASELRLFGASETLFVGASELRFRGASEMLLRGGSEWRLGGGSEQLAAGASEQRLGGASEYQWGGASEALGGASEGWGGASERPPVSSIE